MKSLESNRFLALDGWRGICALLVALMHFQGAGNIYDLSFIRHSGLFVDFFFVLSGFVIFHAYGTRLTSFANIAYFIDKRFARLWPLHISILCFLVVLEFIKYFYMKSHIIPATNMPFDGVNSIGSIFTNILLIQSIGFQNSDTWNTASWSISVEFYTYILFAIIFAIRCSNRIYNLIITAALGGVAYYFFGSDITLGGYFFRCVYSFFMGAIVYNLYQRRPISNFISGKLISLIEFFLIASVIAYVINAKNLSVNMGASVIFALVIYVFASGAGILSRFISLKPFEFLGKLSYSIYMIHESVLIIIGRILNFAQSKFGTSIVVMRFSEESGKDVPVWFFHDKLSTDFSAILYMVLIVICSIFTYHCIEKPGQKIFTFIKA